MLYQVAGYAIQYQGSEQFGHLCHMGFFPSHRKVEAIKHATLLSEMPDYVGMYFVVYQCGYDRGYERDEIFRT